MRRFLILISLLSLLTISWSDYTESDEFKRKIANVERWRSLVDEVQAEEGYDFDTDKVLAIIAQESGGMPRIVSGDKHKSVGLMQCTPQPWTASADRLKIPKVNIQCGLWILNNAMNVAEGDWHDALRFYNCGSENGKKWPRCGLYYADQVLNFWLPHFRTTIIIIPIRMFGKQLGFTICYDKDNSRTCTFWCWPISSFRDYGDWQRRYKRDTFQGKLQILPIQ